MVIDVETKDCTALSDAELAEMADICADGPAGFDIGLLSKQREEWVLITQGREDGKLRRLLVLHPRADRRHALPVVGSGLDQARRPSGTPSLKAVTADQFRRAVLAFPDEDVLVGTRFIDPGAFQAFKGLEDICPRPATRRPARSGRGAGGWPSASAPRAASTTAASSSPVTARRSACFDFEALKPETTDRRGRPPSSSPSTTSATTCSSPSGGGWPRTWRPVTPPRPAG